MRNSLIGLALALAASVFLGSAGPGVAQNLDDYKIIAQAMEMAERAREVAAQARTSPRSTLGVIQAPNGSRYEGETRNSRGHGLGVNTFSNGDRFEGEFRDGRGHGIGVYYYGTGHANFGLWENGISIDRQTVFILAQNLSRIEAEAPGAEARAEVEALAEVAALDALLATGVPLSGRYIVKPQGTGLRPTPENKGTADLIPGGFVVTVTGQIGNWYRVVLDDGREGFTQRFLLDPVAPAAPAAQVAQAPAADEVELAV